MRQSIFQETPYAFKTTVLNMDRTLSYKLPTISFGISDGICYIYAIQKDKEKEQLPENVKFGKKIKRLLYKLDDKVRENESTEYLNYINGSSSYYPENMTDVVPSAILALSLFLNILFENGIYNIKVVPILPIRYNAKKVAFEYKIKHKIKRENLSEIEIASLIKEYSEEHLRIQNNLTQKLLRNFSRLKFHFDNIDFLSYLFEGEEFLSLRISKFEKTNNPILEEIIKNTNIKLK